MCLIGALAASCGDSAAVPPRVGVVVPDSPGTRAGALRQGFAQAADSLGLELITVFEAADSSRETAEVDSLIAARVDALIVVPHPGGTTRSVDAANRAAIPVVTVDVRPPGGRVVAHVDGDRRQGGRMLGAYVGRRLGGGGNVVILDHPGNPAVRDGVAGIREALALHPNIRIVASPGVEEGAPTDARRRMEQLVATGQRIDAVFGPNGAAARAALAVLHAAGRGDVLVVSLEDDGGGGGLAASTQQDATALGRRTVEVVAAHLRGDPVPPVVLIPVTVRMRDTLAAPGAP